MRMAKHGQRSAKVVKVCVAKDQTTTVRVGNQTVTVKRFSNEWRVLKGGGKEDAP